MVAQPIRGFQVVLSNGLRMALAAGAGAAIFVGIVVVVPQRDAAVSEPAPVADPVVAAVTGPVAVTDPIAVVDATVNVTDPPESISPAVAPALDTIYIEPDGNSVIAGRAAAGATVAIMLGNVVMTTVVADADGQFVGLVQMAPSDQPRMLSLVADPNGTAVASTETYLVAPTAAAVVDQPADEPADEPSVEIAALSDADTAEPSVSTPAEAEVVAEDGTPIATDTTDNTTILAEPSTDSISDPPVDTVGPEVAATAPTPSDAIVPADAGITGDAVEGEVAVTEPVDPVGVAPGVADVVAEQGVVDTVSGAAETGVGDAAPVALTTESTADTPTAGTATVQAGPADAETPVAQEPVAQEPVAQEPVAQEPVAQARDAGPAVTPTTEATVAAALSPDVAVLSPAIDSPDTAGDASPPVLVADAAGVRVLQPALAPGAAPELLTTVALDTISYDDSGEVALSGRATGGGFIRVYINNSPIAVATVGSDGQWRADLRDVVAGVYTMRVDQVDADGEVVSRIETPFLREERDNIAAVMAEQTADAGFTVAAMTVQPGNTLWAIARDRYGEGILYVELYDANRGRIRNPDLIYPGQIFVLPEIAVPVVPVE